MVGYTGIVGELEDGQEGKEYYLWTYYLWTHRKFDIGWNGKQVRHCWGVIRVRYRD